MKQTSLNPMKQKSMKQKPMKRKKLWITLLLICLAAAAVFAIYQLNCFTCASGGTFSYGTPAGMGA